VNSPAAAARRLHLALRWAALVAIALSALPAAAQPAAAARRPNVVVILADDLGYSDLGCFGGEIRTPNLDRLAAGGLRMTQFYNGARCCPTRASLMTGLHPHQAGVGRMTADTGLPGYRGFLTDNTVTVAEVLRNAGYRTGMVGKWHLSLTNPSPGHMKRLNNQEIAETFSDPKTYPVGRGFETHYGTIWGVVNFFDPFSLVEDAAPVRSVPKDYYITDALSDRAVKFVEAHGRGEQPFFLYFAPTAPHWPLHAPEADITRYEQTYLAGWDAVRQARYQRMLEKGIVSRDSTPALPPRSDNRKAWADNPTKAWDARAMAVHAAMIDRMDQGIGRLIAKLEELKQLDNTLILFLSDNGASPEIYADGGFDRPSQTRDGRKITYPPNKTVSPGPDDTFFYMGPAWASVANTPLRYWKAEMHEGGICTPLVAHWPAGMKAQAGSVTHQPGHVIDLMATCLELAKAEYPKERAGRPVTPLEGESLVPVLRGERRQGHDVLAWEHFGAKAFREGDWKLVARKDGAWELYDLSKDRVELNNLAAAQPDKVRRLAAKWETWAKRTNVYPMPGAAVPAAPKKG
jgi:arylsulfatase